MTLSLRGRFFLAHVLLVGAAIGFVATAAIREHRRWLTERHFEELERQALRVERAIANAAARGALDPRIEADTLGRLLGARVTLVAGDGRVVGDSEVPAARLAAVANHADRAEIRAALEGRHGRALRRSETIGYPQAYVAVPARGMAGVAVVRLAEPVARVADLNASFVRLALGAALVALLLSVPLAFWASGRHATRIRQLERVSLRLAEGEVSARARTEPDDEVGRLGRAINRMAAESRARLEALEGERDERESMLATLRDGVALLDGAGAVVRMNHAFATLLGASRPAHAGTPFREFVRAPELDDLLHAARRKARTVERDVRLWGAHPRTLHVTATPLREGGAVLLVLHDLSEIERADRVRQEFVANVSHELRTPLTSLRGYAETLLDGGLEDPVHREEFVRVIRDQAARLEALAVDLLSLADLERPGARTRLEALDLRALVEGQVAAFAPRARASGLALTLAPGGPVPVHGDRLRLEQAVANLLDNAVKYTDRGGVRVAVGTENGTAWCEIEDTGAGIPAEDLPRVFERFYRVDKARSRDKGGTGLGLSIVKHAVTLHGGQVSVRSGPATGSAFRFEIPVEPLSRDRGSTRS